MPRGLHRRLDRLAQASALRERRLVVLEVDAERRGDEALVDRALAEAGVEPGPTDLVVKVLRFGPPLGEQPCAVLMVGVRGPDVIARYPVSEVAARYGASSQEDTEDAEPANARWPKDVRTERFPWPPS